MKEKGGVVQSLVVWGIGAFCYPFITVGTGVALGPPPDDHDRTIMGQYQFAGRQVYVTDDGFIGLPEVNEDEGLLLLNILFATALTWQVPSHKVVKNDLCRFKYDAGSTLNIPVENGPSERNTYAFERETAFGNWQIHSRTVVDPNNFKDICSRAEQYLGDRLTKKRYIGLLAAWSLTYGEYLPAAFVYGWFIIETMIEDVCIMRGRKDSKFRGSENWKVVKQIDELANNGIMPSSARKELHFLRRRRNRISHEFWGGVKIEEVRRCLRATSQVLYNLRTRPNRPFWKVRRP